MMRFAIFLSYIRFAAIPMILLVILSLAISLGIVTLPGLGKMLFDKIFITFDPVLLFKYVGIQLFLIVYLALFTILFSITENLLSIRIANGIKIDYSRLLLRAQISFFNKHDSGFLMKRIVEDSTAIADGISKLFIIFSNLLIVGAVIFALNFIQPWLVTLYTALIVGSIIWMSVWVVPIHRFNMKIGAGYSNLYSLFYEILNGIKEVKLQNLYQVVHRKVRKSNHQVKDSILSNTILNCFMWQYSGFFNTVAYSFILILGLKRIEDGDLSVGMLLGLLALISYFQDPIQKIYSSIAAVQAGLAAADRIHVIKNAPREKSGTIGLTTLQSGIRFESVSFSYDGKTNILNSMDLDIPRGAKIAIVGKTGSGKTTLIQLLLQLFDGYTGKIYINDISLDAYTIDSIRDNMVLISQDVHLVRDTIRNNIDLKHNLTDRAVIDIINKVHLDGLLAKLDKGINTVVGDDGMNFSGGERQRIAIARSMAVNPEVIIFDEVTSALDPHNEDLILKNVMDHFSDKTIISISHRRAVMNYCERIYVLKNGSIIEQGSLDELLRLQGEYCRNFLA